MQCLKCVYIVFIVVPLGAGNIYIPLVLNTSPIAKDILQFSSFTSLAGFYFMLLYITDYSMLSIVFSISIGFLYQFINESLTVCNFWSGSTLLGTYAIYDHMLVDLFNMFLSLPGNLLCFVPPLKPYMIQVFVKDWHGKKHIFLLIQTATEKLPSETNFCKIQTSS